MVIGFFTLSPMANSFKQVTHGNQGKKKRRCTPETHGDQNYQPKQEVLKGRVWVTEKMYKDQTTNEINITRAEY